VTLDEARAVTATFVNQAPTITAARVGTSTLKAPSSITFSEAVHGVSSTSVRLVTNVGTTVATSMTCRDIASTTVSCASDVRTAILTPTRPLVPGGYYRLVANPAGTTTIRDVAGAPLATYTSPASRVTRAAEETAFTPSWARLVTTSAIGGNYFRERRAGATFTYQTSGGSLRLWYVKGPDQGMVRISVDGVVRVTALDQYAAGRVYRSYVDVKGLATGVHTVRVTVLGTRRAASTNTYGAVDAVSTTTSACRGDTACAATPPGTYGWAAVATSLASAGRVAAAAAPGSSMTIAFYGTGFDLYRLVGRYEGQMTMWVDGRLLALVDNYATTTSVRAWTKTGLANGQHRLTITIEGRAGRAGAGRTGLAIDRVVVR
jgi:hypothetical protein